MDFRKVSKTLRFAVSDALFTHMTEGKDDFDKCVLGSIFASRHELALNELNYYMRMDQAVTHESQSFLFNEVFGIYGTGWKTSSLIDEATAWVIENDLQIPYEVSNVEYEYRNEEYKLPLITAFTLSKGPHSKYFKVSK